MRRSRSRGRGMRCEDQDEHEEEKQEQEHWDEKRNICNSSVHQKEVVAVAEEMSFTVLDLRNSL